MWLMQHAIERRFWIVSAGMPPIRFRHAALLTGREAAQLLLLLHSGRGARSSPGGVDGNQLAGKHTEPRRRLRIPQALPAKRAQNFSRRNPKDFLPSSLACASRAV